MGGATENDLLSMEPGYTNTKHWDQALSVKQFVEAVENHVVYIYRYYGYIIQTRGCPERPYDAKHCVLD